MKKIYWITALFCFFGLSSWAQGSRAMERIEAAKIAYITNHVELSPPQAERFWPVYHELEKKREALRREYMDLKRAANEENLSEAASDKLVQRQLELQDKAAENERIYTQKLSKILSGQQLLALKKAEADFRKLLLDRLKERRERRGRNR